MAKKIKIPKGARVRFAIGQMVVCIDDMNEDLQKDFLYEVKSFNPYTQQLRLHESNKWYDAIHFEPSVENRRDNTFLTRSQNDKHDLEWKGAIEAAGWNTVKLRRAIMAFDKEMAKPAVDRGPKLSRNQWQHDQDSVEDEVFHQWEHIQKLEDKVLQSIGSSGGGTILYKQTVQFNGVVSQHRGTSGGAKRPLYGNGNRQRIFDEYPQMIETILREMDFKLARDQFILEGHRRCFSEIQIARWLKQSTFRAYAVGKSQVGDIIRAIVAEYKNGGPWKRIKPKQQKWAIDVGQENDPNQMLAYSDDPSGHEEDEETHF